MTAEIDLIRQMTAEDSEYSEFTDEAISLMLEYCEDDINRTAALIWDLKAADVAKNMDFSADGADFSASQVYEHYREMARYYRSLRKAGTVELEKYPRERRSDAVDPRD